MGKFLKVSGKIIAGLGLLCLAYFVIMFFLNGFFSYIEYINQYAARTWHVVIIGGVLLVVGIIILLIGLFIEERSPNFSLKRYENRSSDLDRSSTSVQDANYNYSNDYYSDNSSETSDSYDNSSDVITSEKFYSDGKYVGYKLNDRYYDSDGSCVGYDVGNTHYDSDGNSTGYRIGDREYDSDGHSIGYWVGNTFYEDK